MSDIAGQLQATIEIESIKRMAEILLGSENKKLKNITRFSIPNGLSPVPAGVYPFSPGRYMLLTPDGMTEILEGDFILQAQDNSFYYIRLEKTE